MIRKTQQVKVLDRVIKTSLKEGEIMSAEEIRQKIQEVAQAYCKTLTLSDVQNTLEVLENALGEDMLEKADTEEHNHRGRHTKNRYAYQMKAGHEEACKKIQIYLGLDQPKERKAMGPRVFKRPTETARRKMKAILSLLLRSGKISFQGIKETLKLKNYMTITQLENDVVKPCRQFGFDISFQYRKEGNRMTLVIDGDEKPADAYKRYQEMEQKWEAAVKGPVKKAMVAPAKQIEEDVVEAEECLVPVVIEKEPTTMLVLARIKRNLAEVQEYIPEAIIRSEISERDNIYELPICESSFGSLLLLYLNFREGDMVLNREIESMLIAKKMQIKGMKC